MAQTNNAHLSQVNEVWELSDVLCDIFVAVDVTSSTASILNLVAISIDRYLAIAHPIAYSASSSSHRAVITICLVWLISCCVGAPIILGLNTTPERQSTLCILYNSTFIFWSSLTSFYVPCIIMIGFYWRIFSAIRSRAKKVITTAHQQHPVGSSQSPAGCVLQSQTAQALPHKKQQVAVISGLTGDRSIPPRPLTSASGGGDAPQLQRRSSGNKRQMQSFEAQPATVAGAATKVTPAGGEENLAHQEQQECLNIAHLLKEEKQLKQQKQQQQQQVAVVRNHLPRDHRHVCCRHHDRDGADAGEDGLSHMSDSLCYHSGSQEEEEEEEVDEDDQSLTSRTSGSSSPASSITSSHYDCSLAAHNNHQHQRNNQTRFAGGQHSHRDRGTRDACCALGCPNLDTPTRLAVGVQNGGNMERLANCDADKQRRNRDNRKRSSLFSTTICCDSHATSTGGLGCGASCARCGGGLPSMTTSASFECTSTGGVGLTNTDNNLPDEYEEDLDCSVRCSHCAAASSIVGDVSQARDSPLRSANPAAHQLNGNGNGVHAPAAAAAAAATVQAGGMLESARQTIKRRSMRLTQILRGSRRADSALASGQQQVAAVDQSASASSSSAPPSAASDLGAETHHHHHRDQGPVVPPVKALIIEEPSSSGCRGEQSADRRDLGAPELTSVDGHESERATSMLNVNCEEAPERTGSGGQLKPASRMSCSEANTCDRSTTLTATASSSDPTTTSTTSGEKLVAAAAASAAVTVATTALNNETAVAGQRQPTSNRATEGTKQIVSSMMNLMHKPRSRDRRHHRSLQQQDALLKVGGDDKPLAIVANCATNKTTCDGRQNQQVTATGGQECGVSAGKQVVASSTQQQQQQISKQLQQQQLQHHNHHRGNSRRRREKNAARRERKATKTLAIVLGIFLICWTPFFTCNIIDGICIQLSMDCRPGMMVYLVTSWLGYINSCVNPIIYTIFNMEFRRAFKKILTTRPSCCCSACC